MTQENNNLPSSWIITKLGDVVTSISTNDKKVKQKEYQETGKYPVVDQGQVFIGGYSDDEKLVIDCELPVIIFGDHTKVKKFINFKFVAGADGVKILKPHKCFDPMLFYYFLHCIKFVDKGYARHYQHLIKENIPLPPLPEQHRIVSKLEELFSSLDSAVAALKKAKEQVKTYKQAVLKYAFEGKLTDIDRIINEETGLPEGWKWERLGNVVKTIDGDRGTNYPKKEEFFNEGYCLYLSTKNVRKDRFVFDENYFITKEKDEILRGGKLKHNDVVITTRGTLGNVAIYDSKVKYENIRINSGMLILRISDNFLNNQFLMKFITSPHFYIQLKQRQSGTAQPQIPANILREIKIPIPNTIPEQSNIITEIDMRLSEAENLEKTIDLSLKQAESLRQSILKKAFEGRLVTQDPEDEPAAVLLERIKREKLNNELFPNRKGK